MELDNNLLELVETLSYCLPVLEYINMVVFWGSWYIRFTLFRLVMNSVCLFVGATIGVVYR